MPLFWKPYKSDITAFIEELKAKKPTLEDEQRQAARSGGTAAIDRGAEAEYSRSARAAAGLRLPDRTATGAERAVTTPVMEVLADAGGRRRRQHRRRAPVRRAAVRPAAGPLHPARRARGVPGGVRRAARPAALPDPAPELQHPRHPAGERDPPVPRLRRADPHTQPRARRRLPADGGDADRDQVAHAAAAEEERRRQGARRSARRARAPADRVRADEARRCQARCAAVARPRLRARPGRRRGSVAPRLPVVEPIDLRNAWLDIVKRARCTSTT